MLLSLVTDAGSSAFLFPVKTLGFLFVSLALASVPLLAENPVPAAGRADAAAATTPAIADRQTYLKDFTHLCQDGWPKGEIVNVVCQGHSVPAGYFKTPEVDCYHAYPNLFRAGLVKRFHQAVINVIVSASSGETSEAGAGRFERDALACNPRVITIDYALNDRYIDGKNPQASLERAKRAWISMIERAQAKGIKVILLTPTADLSVAMDDPKDPLNVHAEQIRSLARQYHTGLVDSLAVFKAYGKEHGKIDPLMAQFNHPNGQGHELVANELLLWVP